MTLFRKQLKFIKVRTKLKAFTILEMLMSLGVMTLVISMVYFMYVSFSSQVYGYFNDASSSNQVYGFYKQFRKDAYQATNITKKNNSLILYFYDKKEVYYNFESTQLVRKQFEQLDSIILKEFKISYLGNKKYTKNIVNKITFKTMLLGREIDFTINKKYPCNVLIDINGY